MSKVPEIQDQADILLLNLGKGDTQFALPSKLSAYLFSTKPVIATLDMDSESSKLILKANCGWVLPPDNISILAETMQRVTSIPTE